MKIQINYTNKDITSFGSTIIEEESIEVLKEKILKKGNYKLSELSFKELK